MFGLGYIRNVVDQLLSMTKREAMVISDSAETLIEIRTIVGILLHVCRFPGLITLRTYEGENDMLTFDIVLPALAEPNDVVNRRLTYALAGGEPVVVTLDASATSVDGLQGEQDSALNVELVDIDDAGNESMARVQDFVLLDTIPPPQPGEIGVRVTGES